MIAALAAACWSGAMAASVSAAGTYVALGDSLTASCCVPQGQGFVERFFAYLRSPTGGGLDQLRKYGGESAASMIANQPTSGHPEGALQAMLTDIAGPSNTRVVTIEIGVNDRDIPSCDVRVGGGHNAPGCPFRRNFTVIFDRVKAGLASDRGEEQLLVVAYPNLVQGHGPAQAAYGELVLWGTDHRFDCAGRGRQLGLNDLIICIGLRRGAVVADPYPRFRLGGSSLGSPSPDPHPNGAGYAVMAQALVAASRPTRLALLRIRPSAFEAASAGPTTSAALGTTVSYSLSRADQIAFRVERRQGSRWVALNRSFTRQGEPLANRFRFSGRFPGRSLEPGRYRLVARASGAARGSRPALREFRIVD